VEFDPKPSKFAPPNPNAVQAAITVKAGVSNVIIDLGSHRLAQAGAGSSSQVPYVVGILVPDPAPNSLDPNFVGAESIYIKGDDAIIDGFSMFGIRIFAHTSDIRIEDLTVKNVGALASARLRPFPSYIPHSTGAANTAFGTNDAMMVAAIAIGESRFNGLGSTFFTDSPVPVSRVSSVVLENVSCLNNFYNGLLDACSSDVAINNCHFDRTWSDQPGFTVGATNFGARLLGGALFIGGGFNNSVDGLGVINLQVSNSTFNDTAIRGNGVNTFDFVTPLVALFFGGAQVYDSKNCVWTNCQFNNSLNTFANTSATNFTAGFISGGMVNTTFMNCSFDGAKALAGVNGFHISGSGGTFAEESTRGSRSTLLVNCTANDIQQIGNMLQPAPVPTTGAQAIGFLISFATDIVLENCMSSDVIVNGPMDAAGFAAGFRVAGATTRIDENKVFRGCIAQRSLALNGGQARGFALVATNATAGIVERGIVCENCIAEGNIASPGSGTVPGTTSIGCGFYIEGDSVTPPNATSDFPFSFVNCKALRNKGVPSAVVGALTQYSAGFYCLGLQRSSFNRCEALNNINGFLLQLSDRNTIRDCRADNNLEDGTNIGSGFVDVGTGTTAAPTQSTSIWESNRAFANGNNSHVGPNSNYNIWMNAALTLRPPLLRGQASTGAYTFTDPNVTYFSNVHNNSIIP